MEDTTKNKPAYILGSDSKMVAMRLPASTRERLDALSKAEGKSKTLIVVEAIDAMAGGAE